MASVPADCVFGEDNVTVAYLDPGFPVYAGYWNGFYANMHALGLRFPGSFLISVATRLTGSKGSISVDIEPGTLATDQITSFQRCLAWVKQGGWPSVPGKPVIYVMASWARALEGYLAAHGVARSAYYLWTAHYIGLHLCSPSGCGYGASTADATQYASGRNDHNVFRGYVAGHGTPPHHVPGLLQMGDTGAEVKAAQVLLNGFAKAAGYSVLIADGDFGGKTYHAVRLFQAYKKLQVDGAIGPKTAAALKTKPPIIVIRKPKVTKPVVPPGVPVLKLGMIGKQVAAMQYYLRNSGIPGVRGINADGDFGPQTEAAVKNFQAFVKLTNDGIYGIRTAKALARIAVG